MFNNYKFKQQTIVWSVLQCLPPDLFLSIPPNSSPRHGEHWKHKTEVARCVSRCVLERKHPGLYKTEMHILLFIIWYVCGNALKIRKYVQFCQVAKFRGYFGQVQQVQYFFKRYFTNVTALNDPKVLKNLIYKVKWRHNVSIFFF